MSVDAMKAELATLKTRLALLKEIDFRGADRERGAVEQRLQHLLEKLKVTKGELT
jgi:hypothetical protein